MGFTFEDGQAIYPGALDPNWHVPMVMPGQMNTGATPNFGTPSGNDPGGNNDDDDGGGDGGDPD